MAEAKSTPAHWLHPDEALSCFLGLLSFADDVALYANLAVPFFTAEGRGHDMIQFGGRAINRSIVAAGFEGSDIRQRGDERARGGGWFDRGQTQSNSTPRLPKPRRSDTLHSWILCGSLRTSSQR